mgnify:CR=1 FL=1|tara:strand:+ start:114 stop:1019 length:906 start_codon:yes stop_codon:yes gene_type:complete
MKIISAETSLVGVIGNPIQHSLSPIIHNAALEKMGLDWCYLAIPCETKNLEIVINGLEAMKCKGLNITIPHKQDAIKSCKRISKLAQQIGAINTLIRDKEGGWVGTNTDIDGFIAPLKDTNWKSQKAIILGCGGSARAVFSGLNTLNFDEIIIIGRDKIKLDNFIKNMRSNFTVSKEFFPSIQGVIEKDSELIEYIKNADLIVNTTPVGMKRTKTKFNQSIEMPLGKEIWENLKSSATLYDLIYNPRPTAWLENGERYNCKIIDGLEMLIQQGAASLKLWSGFEEIPTKTMRIAAKKFLLC